MMTMKNARAEIVRLTSFRTIITDLETATICKIRNARTETIAMILKRMRRTIRKIRLEEIELNLICSYLKIRRMKDSHSKFEWLSFIRKVWI